MTDYSGHWSKGGRSSVFKTSKTSKKIRVYFKDRQGKKKKYYYYKSDMGSSHFNNMKSLISANKGLNSYILKNRIPHYKIQNW